MPNKDNEEILYVDEIVMPDEEGGLTTQKEQVKPYNRTQQAQEEAYKSWRTMLADNYKKRQEENKKRVRSAQIVGLGKALGDLVGGIWGGVASSKNNAPAVVPAMQSSKTSEQIEKLINEGVVNTKDYDNMLLNLAMQEEKDKIALAKAYDELGIKHGQLAEQRAYEAKKLQEQRSYDEQKAEKAFERQKELRRITFTNNSSLLKQRGENAIAVAQVKKGDKDKGKATFSDGDKAILGAIIPDTITKEGKYGEVEVPNKPTTNQLMLKLARQKELMKRYKLDPNSEEDKQKWATIVSNHNILIAALPDVAQERIMAALLAGYTGEEILAHFRK